VVPGNSTALRNGSSGKTRRSDIRVEMRTPNLVHISLNG
jgi:hypothetical protein